MGSKYKNEKIENIGCCLSEKGSIEILHYLEEGGTLRFNEIKQRLAGISPRTLAKRLKQLEGINLLLAGHMQKFLPE